MRAPRRSRYAVVALALWAATASNVSAQARASAPKQPPLPSTQTTLRTVADLVARNDSLGALTVLDSALARDRLNGALWHRYGSIAWGMSKTEKGPVMRPHMIRLRMRADSAMRYATSFAPDSAQYWLDLGRYELETNNVFVRAAAKGSFEDGLKVAKASGNAHAAAELIDQIGMVVWRDYDNVNHRALESADDFTVTASGVQSGAPTNGGTMVKRESSAMVQAANATGVAARDLVQFYRDRMSLVQPITGEAVYVEALQKFRDAFATDTTNTRIRRHLYMALADHKRWPDLLGQADRTLRADDDDIEAWLSRGLAATSLEDYPNAADAFDNALRRMTPAARKSFTDIKRMLGPYLIDKKVRFADSVHWDSLSAGERKRQETLFWNLADPRAGTRVNEALVEFYARVAFADLRFGSEEFRVRGADSPRGDTYVRYGPPDVMYSVPRMGSTTIIWLYDKRQLAFVFNMAPTFGTANWPFGAQDVVDSIHAEHPSGWDNMPLARRTWPMRIRVARFRATTDSMDAVVTATVPVRSFLGGAELSGALPIHVQLDVHDSASRIVGREVRQVAVSTDSLPVGINGAWVRRIGPGLNVVRIDAEQRDANRAATAETDAIIEKSTGFGISDLLLGNNVGLGSSGTPKRWRDVSIAPSTGVFSWAQSLGVVWEAYDLTPQDGNVRYRVNLELSRTFQSNIVGFIARVFAIGKNVIERDGSGTGSVNVGFEQLRPASPIIADFLSINLKGSVPGTYKLTIEIEDLVSKRKVSRTTPFVLTKD